MNWITTVEIPMLNFQALSPEIYIAMFLLALILELVVRIPAPDM